MFGTCTHGFISTTCPHCRGSRPMDMDDSGYADGDSVRVDMGRIIDATVDRVERTGLREYRREVSMIKRSL